MTVLALALVLASAVTHATWNLLIKRAGHGASGAAFAWLFAFTSSVAIAPAALWLLAAGRGQLGVDVVWPLAVSALLHSAYFRLLQHGYRVGDLSIVYPLARGTGPLIATAGAVVLLTEPHPAIVVAGAALVVTGIALVAGPSRASATSEPPGTRRGWRADARRRRGIGLGIGVGVVIGTYTLWDRQLVAGLAVPPLVLEWVLSTAMAALLAPAALRDRPAVLRVWRERRWTMMITAVMSSASYILFLSALAITPVSRVAPAREVSILIGTALSSRMLGERETRRRVAGAAVMVLGVAFLALG